MIPPQQDLLDLISSQLISSSPYNPSSVIQLFTPTFIASMHSLLPKPSSITLIEFMKSTLKLLPLRLQNRPKLIYSLFKLFQEICKTKDSGEFSWEEFTSFLANKTPDMARGSKIQEKVLPYKVDIDRDVKHKIKPPQVIGSSKHELRRLNPNMTNSDKLHHINRKIEKTCYSPQHKLFFVLDSPSRYIDILDREYVPKYRLTTTEQVSSKEAIIISFHWSESTSRVGCIFANYSTSFWALADEFKYQLSCPLKLDYIKHPPNKIYYVESEKKWIKLDNKPIIYILNDDNFEISDSFSHSRLVKQESTSLILLSQVAYHKLLIIGFQKSVFLLSLSRKQIATSIQTPQTSVFTLTFSQTYQTLLVSCFQNYIYCYQLSQFCDLSLKGNLSNNLEISTSMIAIPQSPIIVSIQDNAHVKLWNVCDCNSFQYFMTYKNLQVREMLVVENGVVLVGSKLLQFSFEEEKKENVNEYNALVDVWVNKNAIVAVGVHNISIYNLETGWPIRIIKSPMEEAAISFSAIVQTQNYLVIVSEEAKLIILNLKDGEVIVEMVFKEKKVVGLKYDAVSNMVCVGFQSQIQLLFFHQYQELQTKRRLKIDEAQLVIMEVSSYHDLIVIGFEKQKIVDLFTFEKLGHVKSLKLDFVPSSIELVQDQKIIVISGSKQIIVVKYFLNQLYKTTTQVEVIARIGNQSKSIGCCKVLTDAIYFGDNQGKIATFTLAELSTEELQTIIYNNSYNPNRILEQSHTFSFRPFTPLPSSDIPIIVPPSHKISKRAIISMKVIVFSIIVIIYQSGYIKLYDKEFAVKGSVDVKESFPQIWNVASNHNTMRDQIKLILQILSYLRTDDPVYEEYFTIPDKDEDQKGVNKEKYRQKYFETQNLTFRKSTRANTYSVNPKPTPYSLRQVKRVLQRQRQEAKSSEKYQNMLVKSKSKQRKSKRTIQDTKQILRFFNKDITTNKKLPISSNVQLPESVKNLELKLNRIVEDYVTQSIKEENEQKKKRKSMKMARRSTTKAKPDVLELEFLHTEINNEKFKRFSKSKSLSLPKLQIRPKAAMQELGKGG